MSKHEEVMQQILDAISRACSAADGLNASHFSRAYVDLLYVTAPRPVGIDSAAALELRAIEQNGSNA